MKMKKLIIRILYYLPVVLVFLGLVIISLSLIYPVAWGLINSFKDIFDYTIDPNGLPTNWNFSNYANIIKNLKADIITSKGIIRLTIGDMAINTILWSVFSPLPTAIFNVLMAYIIAIYRNIFTKFLFNLGVVLMCLVLVGTFPAQYTIYGKLNMLDNMFMMIILSPQGCFSGFNFLLYYNIFKNVPRDYADAAKIDGAGHFTVMNIVYIPNIITTFLVLYVLSFLGCWNDYNTFLIYLPSYANLAFGMYIYQYNATINMATMPEILAGFFVVALPTIILYLSIDKYLVEKLKVSGLKG